ncbi:MAG: tRNA lysidine(34) synthetase TilS [Campylobacterales bacterium]|nr:tRNA lysidine(34) synthetase TilS [Campylobacterales bacterium]
MTQEFIELTKGKRLLLAFSAGIDSSALFFLLMDAGVNFDIAIVDYETRAQSKKEVAYAQELAQKYALRCYETKAPKFSNNFEANARAFRYDFFEDIIVEHGYDILLTAHQLNDKLEWFLMRFVKGSGVCELIGLEAKVQKERYLLLRPLLGYAKSELLAYLEKNKRRYFIDDSNSDESYERNFFRKHYSDALLTEFRVGIQRSFDYMKDDCLKLQSGYKSLYAQKELRVLKIDDMRVRVNAIDKTLKELGYLLSKSQRDDIKKNDSLVIGGSWAVEIYDDKIYISPYVDATLPKEFKELCRVAKIPPKVRPYCFKQDIEIDKILNSFD